LVSEHKHTHIIAQDKKKIKENLDI